MSEDPGVDAPAGRDRRIPVLLVGSFHMANPGRDVANALVDDMQAERRQAELEDLAGRLAAFGPTKVAVELPWDDEAVGLRYRAYREGCSALRTDESEQIGFRVARRCGHEAVWPVDVQDTFFDPEIEKVAAGHPGHQAHYDEAVAAAQRCADDVERWLAHSTVADTLRRMNEPDALRAALALYIDFLTPVADPPAWPGPDMVGAWFRRNLRILAVLHAMSRPDDRLLVVFGQGHVAVWHHLLAVSETFEAVDPVPWLAGPADGA